VRTRTWLPAMLALLWCSPTFAQLFSPGDLATPHAALEGLSNCLKCHEQGQRLSDAKCLACHQLIAVRVKERRGFHGRQKASCASCHPDHRGKGAKLISFIPSEARFPHQKTGWPLKGAHGKLSCKTCHEKRRIAPEVRTKLKKRRRSFLGLPTTCRACHFDEHRGQLKTTDCKRCHSEEAFKPARGFRHNRDARFKLTGKHRRVSCRKCHANERDEGFDPKAYPTPRAETYAHYRPLPHRRCTNCHRDPHKGARGRNCTSCHSTNGWDVIKETSDLAFHAKTRFPLVGEHDGVACKLCHGPFKGEREPTYKGLHYTRCDDCHFDAHNDQLDEVKLDRNLSLNRRLKLPDAPKPAAASPQPAATDCSACHDERGFFPAFFEREDHEVTTYALDGSHQAVGCRGCHANNTQTPRSVRRSRKRFAKATGRATPVSTVVFARETTDDCAACHADVHQGQFAAREEGCKACHQVSTFTDVRFDHNTGSRFPLRGAHEGVSCRRCHDVEETQARGRKKVSFVRYRPRRTDCASCHTDQHAGQLADTSGATRCERCHASDGFKSAPLFDHDLPSMARFPLRGRHRELDCAACHRPIAVEGGGTTTWYRGLPRTCAGCHVDQHDGRFDRFTP
jgi:hypothetical protein